MNNPETYIIRIYRRERKKNLISHGLTRTKNKKKNKKLPQRLEDSKITPPPALPFVRGGKGWGSSLSIKQLHNSTVSQGF